MQKTVNQSIGIRYLSSIAKSKGWQCELFVEPFEKNIFVSLKSYSPDIIGFSIVSGAQQWALRLSGELKKILPKAVIVFGGPGPTFSPEMIYEPYVDAIAIGEAENSFPEFVNRMVHGQDFSDVPGFWVKDKNNVHCNNMASLTEDLSLLPYPDYELYQKYRFYRTLTQVPFVVRRGCPFRCSFCCAHAAAKLYKDYGKYDRTRSVDNVIKEIEIARTVYPKMRSVILYDTIGIDKEWSANFTDMYTKRVSLPWSTSSRADLVDEPMAEQLSKSNCYCVSLGVETGDENLRVNILGKRIFNSQYIKAAQLLHRAGIKVNTSNMLFLPGEDITKALKTVDLNRKMKTDYTSVFIMQPYPGTDIYNYAIKNDYLPKDFKYKDIDHLSVLRPVIRLKDSDKILVVHRMFYFSVHNSLMRKMLNLLLLFPPNFLFEIGYYCSTILSYAAYHRVSIIRALYIARTNYKEKFLSQIRHRRPYGH